MVAGSAKQLSLMRAVVLAMELNGINYSVFVRWWYGFGITASFHGLLRLFLLPQTEAFTLEF